MAQVHVRRGARTPDRRAVGAGRGARVRADEQRGDEGAERDARHPEDSDTLAGEAPARAHRAGATQLCSCSCDRASIHRERRLYSNSSCSMCLSMGLAQSGALRAAPPPTIRLSHSGIRSARHAHRNLYRCRVGREAESGRFLRCSLGRRCIGLMSRIAGVDWTTCDFRESSQLPAQETVDFPLAGQRTQL